ncbi:MAG: LysM peptidoglycan-binding domain-containing protein [Bacteroidetes bacterium]|nr:LysM peptidoglycan-binding domain-containing protein [Bacteroidota bacterium]
MKKIKILIVAIGFSLAAMSQKTNTISHTIKKGENISTLARMYGVPTSEILQANGLNDKTILKIGQIIIIPKGKGKQPDKQVEEKPTAKPVVKPNANQYLIQSGDNLSKIAKKFGVSEKDLREWNNLSNDNIKAGSLITISKNGIASTTPKVVKEEKKAEPIVKKEAPKKIEPQIPVAPVEKVEEPKPVVTKVDPKIEEPVKKETKEIVTTTPKDIKPESLGKGAFEGQFENTRNSVEGMCGVFKTIAGWHDTKYYILMNSAENGSVVKVLANNKFVYAKVLGPLPDIKEDKNVVMRISNAAAAALGIADNRFNAKVEF